MGELLDLHTKRLEKMRAELEEEIRLTWEWIEQVEKRKEEENA